MEIEPKYLDISFTSVGIRNSQKRLESLIAEAAVEPINEFENELRDNFDLVEAIVRHRIARVIAYWCKNKHDPVIPLMSDRMSDITNASKNDVTLEEFYSAEVSSALQSLAVMMGLEVPADYEPRRDVFADELGRIGYQAARVTEEPDEEYEADDDELSVDAVPDDTDVQPDDEGLSDAELDSTDNQPDDAFSF